MIVNNSSLLYPFSKLENAYNESECNDDSAKFNATAILPICSVIDETLMPIESAIIYIVIILMYKAQYKHKVATYM